MESDARAINPAPEHAHDGPRCTVCQAPIRGHGPGQRPSYCGRGCSSKAYRARRKAEQNALLAAAVDGSREPTGDPSGDHIGRLGAVVERSARALARTLAQDDLGPLHAQVSLSVLVRSAENLLAAAQAAVRTAGTNLGDSRVASGREVVPPAGQPAR
ncbi:hypothetical protein ACW14Y_42840 (plasmid) [Kitasatospora sp. cg17-2]